MTLVLAIDAVDRRTSVPRLVIGAWTRWGYRGRSHQHQATSPPLSEPHLIVLYLNNIVHYRVSESLQPASIELTPCAASQSPFRISGTSDWADGRGSLGKLRQARPQSAKLYETRFNPNASFSSPSEHQEDERTVRIALKIWLQALLILPSRNSKPGWHNR